MQYLADGRHRSIPSGLFHYVLPENDEITIFDSPRVWMHRTAYRTLNCRRDGNLVTIWTSTDDLAKGLPSRKCVWRLTGTTHPEDPDYEEAIWPD